jgi:hypothetical protein
MLRDLRLVAIRTNFKQCSAYSIYSLYLLAFRIAMVPPKRINREAVCIILGIDLCKIEHEAIAHGRPSLEMHNVRSRPAASPSVMQRNARFSRGAVRQNEEPRTMSGAPKHVDIDAL